MTDDQIDRLVTCADALTAAVIAATEEMRDYSIAYRTEYGIRFRDLFGVLATDEDPPAK